MVAAAGRLVLSCSADDSVRALDAASGEQSWVTWAEAPVRLAPSIWSQSQTDLPAGEPEEEQSVRLTSETDTTAETTTGTVVFGADDGFVYGVDLDSGTSLWRTRPTEVGLRRIPGNGRIISERPIRSSVLVNPEGTGFFAAGIFPEQGAFFYSIDVRTGKLLDRAKIEKSVQGYLEQRDGSVFAPTGRDRQGAFLTGEKQPSRSNTLADDTFCSISDPQYVYVGKQDLVVAMSNGKPIWQASVDGAVYDLAIADGRLFVSTDQGAVYAFGQPSNSRVGEKQHTPSIDKSPSLEQEAQRTEQPDAANAYVLSIAPQSTADFDQLLSWAQDPQLRPIAIVSDQKEANDLRQRLLQRGLRAAIHVHDLATPLPYANHIFTRIRGGKKSMVQELLNPHGGVAECIDGIVKASAPTRDSWSHPYASAGNSTSSDTRIGAGRLALQWFGGPGPREMVDRHLRTMPPVASGGVMYLPGLDQVLAVDAYTGAMLWSQYLPNSSRIGILKDCGWMVATPESVLVAHQNAVTEYRRADDGGSQPIATRVFQVPLEGRHWGFLAHVGNRILGSGTLPASHRKTVNREAILEGAYTDHRPIVCSDSIFSFDRETQATWHYPSRGAILNPSIAANQTHVFFLENGEDNLESYHGRIPLQEFLTQAPQLVALDLGSGKPSWRTALPRIQGAQNAYVLCNDNYVLLVNSRNDETVHYDVRVYHASDGELKWQTTQDNRLKTGGDHGEQDKHPVLVGDQLIVEPFAYDVTTGKRITEFDLGKRGYGCGTLSASAEALFFRSGNPAKYSLGTQELERITSVTRPGCWINMIPSSGMLLIPEGSSGCTCNFAIQSSMAFVNADE